MMNYTAAQAKDLREANPFDSRNIRDEFKGKSVDTIKEELLETETPLVIIAENLIGDFNIAQVVRSANAFNAAGVYICGNRKWNKRGAVGTYHYIDVEHWEFVQEAIGQLRDREYKIVAAEITPDAIPLKEYIWAEKTALIVGEEGRGLSEIALKLVDDVVYIPMLGTVRSLNVAGASQIVMYDYMVKNGYI